MKYILPSDVSFEYYNLNIVEPKKYSHQCNKCNHIEAYDKIYPSIEYDYE